MFCYLPFHNMVQRSIIFEQRKVFLDFKMAKKLYMIYFVCIPFGFVSGLPKPAFCLGMEGLDEALVLLQVLISN